MLQLSGPQHSSVQTTSAAHAVRQLLPTESSMPSAYPCCSKRARLVPSINSSAFLDIFTSDVQFSSQPSPADCARSWLDRQRSETSIKAISQSAHCFFILVEKQWRDAPGICRTAAIYLNLLASQQVAQYTPQGRHTKRVRWSAIISLVANESHSAKPWWGI